MRYRHGSALIVGAVFAQSGALAHDCPNYVILDSSGPISWNNLHECAGSSPYRTIANYAYIGVPSDSTTPSRAGQATARNSIDDLTVNESVQVRVTGQESFSVSGGITAGVKAQAKAVVLPVGAEWSTEVRFDAGYSGSRSFEFTSTTTVNIPPCRIIEVVKTMSKTRRQVVFTEGRWELWLGICPTPASMTVICGPVDGDAHSVRMWHLDSDTRNANPSRVEGCGGGNAGGGDNDGDGIPNDEDPDVDGDNIPNGQDPDVDGDNIPNGDDPDVDGDGLDNGEDPDIDGDGKPNAEDSDMDGDGIPNDEDSDMDGDGLENDQDPDMDGDGVSNENDNDPDGPSEDINWVDLIIRLLNVIVRIATRLA